MENWKLIEEFPMYEASDLGNVRNKKTHRQLKYAMINAGYYVVPLRKDGKTFNKSVHRIIAQTWVRNNNPKDQTIVNHINHDKLDNRAENLEWVTFETNVLLGAGPTQLRVLKSMIGNALNKAINEWYNELLTVKATKEVFTEELINKAIQEAINTFKERDNEH